MTWISMTWIRRHRIVAAAALVLVVAVAAGLTDGIMGAGGGPGHPARLAAPPLPAEAATTRGARWLTGRAGRLLQAVNTDVGRLSATERAGSRAAAQAAGTQLAAAARAARRGPMPPVDKKLYRSALNDLRKSGSYAARGKFDKSRTLLPTGENGLTKVTAAVDNPGKKSAPLAISEPGGK
jgi:hypothetical protein